MLIHRFRCVSFASGLTHFCSALRGAQRLLVWTAARPAEVIRVITAIFLRETLEAANNDAELMVQEGLRRKATYIHKLESSLAR